VQYATTDNFLKRFKLKSLSELPDYADLMQKIAELNATNIESTYLYEKDVYNPDDDAELAQSSNDTQDAVPTADGFELPDFLKDIEEGIIKIQ
jgi:hypothetical protein